jgi:hypothetical protein
MDSSWMDSAEKHGIVSAHQAKATKQVRDPRGSLKIPNPEHSRCRFGRRLWYSLARFTNSSEKRSLRSLAVLSSSSCDLAASLVFNG